MAFRLVLVLAAIIVAFFLYLSSLNQEVVSLQLSGSRTYDDVRLIHLLALSFMAGIAVSYLLLLIRRAGTFWAKLRDSRQKKAMESAERLLMEAKRALMLQEVHRGRELLKKSIAASSHLTEPYILLMESCLESGDLEQATETAAIIPHSLENNFEILLSRIQLNLAGREYTRAAELIKGALKHEKSTGLKRLLRDAYMKADRWDDAAGVHDEIRKEMKGKDDGTEERESVRIAYEIARGIDRSGNPEEAARRLKDIIKRSPDYTPPHVFLGKIQRRTGSGNLAEQTWIKGYELTGNMIFLFLLEDLCLKEEDPQRIIDIYTKLIAEDPANARLHLFLGKLYLRLEMIDDAGESLDRAGELELESRYLSMLAGEVLFRKERFREAARSFKDSLGIDRTTLIPFVCDSCGRESRDWKGTCQECGGWDSLHIDLAEKA